MDVYTVCVGKLLIEVGFCFVRNNFCVHWLLSLSTCRQPIWQQRPWLILWMELILCVLLSHTKCILAVISPDIADDAAASLQPIIQTLF